MSDGVRVCVYAIVEGGTERLFVQNVLAPYLSTKGVDVKPAIASKQGEKGGDIRFNKMRGDIENSLKQRADTYVTTMIDYYGTKDDWPGFKEVKEKKQSGRCVKAEDIANGINKATMEKIKSQLNRSDVEKRFIPYMSIHEFEALLFSNVEKLAETINALKKQKIKTQIKKVLADCGNPEDINNNPQSVPSKRFAEWSEKKFGKTTQGVNLAKSIGVEEMRSKCHVFNQWIKRLESLKPFDKK